MNLIYISVLFLAMTGSSISHADEVTSEATQSQKRTNLHFQVTTVTQDHGSFVSPYEGQDSLSPGFDSESSLTWTVFGGAKLWRGAEVYINPELAGGAGFNKTQGLAGFPNGEIYRVDDASPKWNVARVFYKQVFGFGDKTEELKDEKNQLPALVNVERLTVVVGRFSLNDYFDNNTYSHDPRTQFLNWALMDQGAWDYAADTKGYTWGLYLEWNEPSWTLRFASVGVPARANQMEFDRDIPDARGDNLEFESRYKINLRPGAVRLLAYENHANMGNYRTTVDTPSYQMDITQSRSSSVKYGFGVNAEQELADDFGIFARAAWNDGHTETWAFTEIDQSVSLGLAVGGKRWSRADDHLGFAILANGLSADHKAYLAAGGYGFIVGDGKLTYAPEEIVEFYYSFRMLEGLDLTADGQYVQNPAYNSDRGPVAIYGARLHYEL